MDRQTLRDAVLRFNAEGPAGLADRPKRDRERLLTADEEASLSARVLRGPDPQVDGGCAWRRPDLCRWLQDEFGKTDHPSSLARVLQARLLAPDRTAGAAAERRGSAASPPKGLLAA
jgi:transposase